MSENPFRSPYLFVGKEIIIGFIWGNEFFLPTWQL